jgi:CspA family cold shock protein
MSKETGKVLWFDVVKGYGFIRRKTGQDVFVHFSKIVEEDGVFKTLEQNDIVEFEVFEADRGNGTMKPQAKEVRVIGGKRETKREHRSTTIRGQSKPAKKD